MKTKLQIAREALARQSPIASRGHVTQEPNIAYQRAGKRKRATSPLRKTPKEYVRNNPRDITDSRGNVYAENVTMISYKRTK